METKFDYVYRNLKEKIISGVIPNGNRLSSSRKLCDEFQVSIYTITNVLNKLKEEGLIVIEPRKTPKVIYNTNKNNTLTKKILSHRDILLQIYETMSLILPAILTFSAKGLDSINLLPNYIQIEKIKKRALPPEQWRIISNIYLDILKHSGNPLFPDLYNNFELHSYLSFFAEEQKSYTGISIRDSIPDIKHLATALNLRDPYKRNEDFKQIYNEVYSIVKYSLKKLEQTTNDLPEQTGSFSWNIRRGKDFRYRQITQDLIDKIGKGVYPNNTFLPSEAILAKEYNASVSTIRKSISVLNKIKFTRTLNGKGTLVLTPDETYIYEANKNPIEKRNSLLYLYALQLMILIIGVSSKRAAKKFTDEQINILMDKAKDIDNISFDNLLNEIINKTDLKPLKEILIQTNKVIEWGYYLSLYNNKTQSICKLNKKSLQACYYLKKKDYDSFAFEMEDCFRLILKAVRKHMIEINNIKEAEKIIIP